MVRRSGTSRHSRSAAAAEPIFVDRSGRRLRRLRLFGGVTLVGVAVYIAMIATAFFGGSDVSMPFLPQFAAGSDDASRPLPANAPAPDPVQPVPAAPEQPAASESPSEPEPGEPSPAPTAAPAEPTADAPGKSESAPGQTNPAEPPAPQHP